MEARIARAAVLFLAAACSLGARYATENFVVTAPDPQLAQQVALAAERFRKELAVAWLGRELEPWSDKCPITVRIAPHAGGQTSFAFDSPNGRSMPFGWQMEVFGSPERILDSVLPHEVTHTIFATHFGRPLPRWADEGACTTVEHESERAKNHQMLIRYLTSNRGIPFNRMFSMKQYPHDIYPLYAQGYSLARFLIQQRGRQTFIRYVGAGMAAEDPAHVPRSWDAATREFYGYRDLSELQIEWVRWVKQGCPAVSAVAATGTAESAKSHAAAVQPNETPVATAPPTEGGTSSWYRASTARAAVSPAPPTESDRAPRAGLEQTPSVASSGAEVFRPGSIADGASFESLCRQANIAIVNSTLKPSSRIHYTAPVICPLGESGSVWR